MKLRKVSDGPFAYEPGRCATYQGEPIAPGMLAHLIVGAIMSARGEVVRYEEFNPLTKSLQSDRTNSVRVTVHRLRKRLRALGAPVGVIQVVAGHGIRWDRTAMEREAA